MRRMPRRSAAACRDLAQRIKALIGITVAVAAGAPGAIERSIGKAKRVVDRRGKS